MDKDREKYFKKQAEQYGGFCGYCGNAVEPVLNEDYTTFGLCEDPRGHDIMLVELVQMQREL